ncbi:hypothetical protein QBC43DRAFT_333919 [Cladorrhinum sp. PSN259]|nr:hypothetical protein QBC43DRAFT_333919 [Cladorrhinum sp. PSN259]
MADKTPPTHKHRDTQSTCKRKIRQRMLARRAHLLHLIDLRQNPLLPRHDDNDDKDKTNNDTNPIPILDDSELSPLSLEGRTSRLRKSTPRQNENMASKKDERPADRRLEDKNKRPQEDAGKERVNNGTSGEKRVKFKTGVYLRVFTKGQRIGWAEGRNTEKEEGKEEQEPKLLKLDTKASRNERGSRKITRVEIEVEDMMEDTPYLEPDSQQTGEPSQDKRTSSQSKKTGHY